MKLFRKIRQKNLTENKFGKYLIYAIGEIILVVIGILIAFKVNNWKELKSDERIKTVFLQDFISDLKTDIKTISYRIKDNKERLVAIDSISSILSTKSKLSKKELTEFNNYHYTLITESYFITEKSTIRQFETSNKGNLILPKKIKDKLFKYYSMNDRIEQNDEKSIQLYQHNFITKEIITPILGCNVLGNTNNLGLNSTDLRISELKNNNEYFFALSIKKISTYSQNNRYQLIIDTAEELVELLSNELTE